MQPRTSNLDTPLSLPLGTMNATVPILQDLSCGFITAVGQSCTFGCPSGWCQAGTQITCEAAGNGYNQGLENEPTGKWTGYNQAYCVECTGSIQFQGSFSNAQNIMSDGAFEFGDPAASSSSSRRMLDAFSPSKMALVFEGPPNSIVSIDWIQFDLSECGLLWCDGVDGVAKCPGSSVGQAEWVTVKVLPHTSSPCSTATERPVG